MRVTILLLILFVTGCNQSPEPTKVITVTVLKVKPDRDYVWVVVKWIDGDMRYVRARVANNDNLPAVDEVWELEINERSMQTTENGFLRKVGKVKK